MFLESNKRVIFFLFFILTNAVYSQHSGRDYKDTYVDHSVAVNISLSGNSYEFMALRQYLGALNVMIKVTKDEELIQKQITLINNVMNTSQVSNSIVSSIYPQKDEFRGWIVHRANDRNIGAVNVEVPLFESYSFFYIAEFLHLLKENGWVNQSLDNKKWWENTVGFVEQHIWTKWRTRSHKINGGYNAIFLRGRTHMGSHWAGIASYLHEVTTDMDIKQQTSELVQQYDRLLKRNLRLKKGAYVWNATYDDVMDTDASYVKENIIQDGSHGNHVISYVVAAYELGNKNWTKKDLQRFSNTITKVMYDKKTNTFADNVDGSRDRTFTGRGNFVGDGWVKLGYYDKTAAKVFKRFSNNESLLRRYNQNLQFKATFLKVNR